MQQSMAQINVRIEKSLKTAGDAALVEEGLSPSEVVRALWRKISQRGKDFAEVREVLFSGEDAGIDATSGEKSLLEQGWHCADELYRSCGYDVFGAPAYEKAWDDLYAEALDAHFDQRGLYG